MFKKKFLTVETDPPTPGSSGEDDNVASTKNQDPMSKPTTNNGGRGLSQGGRGGRGGYQGRGRQGGRFNRTPNTPSIRNFKGKVQEFNAVLGTTAKKNRSKRSIQEI